MDKKILSHYNSAKGLADYTNKFKRHWTERLNNRHEQQLIRRLLRFASITTVDGVALDLPCGYGRLYPIVREVCQHVVESDWSFPLAVRLQSMPAKRTSNMQRDWLCPRYRDESSVHRWCL